MNADSSSPAAAQAVAPPDNSPTWMKYVGNSLGGLFGAALVLMNHADCNLLVLNVRALLHWILGMSVGVLLLLTPAAIKAHLRDWSACPSLTAVVVKVDDPMARLPQVVRGHYIYRKLVWIQRQAAPSSNIEDGVNVIQNNEEEETIVAVRQQDEFAVGDAITLVLFSGNADTTPKPVYVPFQRYMAQFVWRKLGWALLGVIVATVALVCLFPGAPVVLASSEQVAQASERYLCFRDMEDDQGPCCQISTMAAWGYNVFCTFPTVLLAGFTLRRLWLARNRKTQGLQSTEPLVQAESELM